MLKNFFLLAILVLILSIFFYFHLYDYLNLSFIKNSNSLIQHWINNHYIATVSIYMLVFIILIACTIPAATFLSIIGGYLFGTIAFIYAVIATVLGGTVLFFAVRTAVGSFIAEKSSGWIKKLEEGFKRDAFYYLISFRLVPFFPCWISNISAGALNVPFKTFLLATFIGIMPSTFICVLVGRGLVKLANANEQTLMNILFKPAIFFPMLGLALLSIGPIIYKVMLKNKIKRVRMYDKKP